MLYEVITAVSTLTEALAGGSEDAETYYYLVALLGDGGNYPEAMRYAREVV